MLTLINTPHYKVKIKGKVEQSREWNSVLSYTSVYELLKKEPSGHTRLRLPTLLTLNRHYKKSISSSELEVY